MISLQTMANYCLVLIIIFPSCFEVLLCVSCSIMCSWCLQVRWGEIGVVVNRASWAVHGLLQKLVYGSCMVVVVMWWESLKHK